MELSRRAMELLREASRSPLTVCHGPVDHRRPSGDFVVRQDGRGATFQKKTLESLLKAGLIQELADHCFVASEAGRGALA